MSAPRTAALALLLALGLAACTAPTGETEEPAGTPMTSAEPAAGQAPDPEPGGETTAEGGIVELSGTGVGPIADETPDAREELEALLGPADEFQKSPLADCGAPFISSARWGSLLVTMNEGALFGWQVNSVDGVPETVALPYGLPLGTPMASITDLPGAGPVEYLENYLQYTVTAGGVTWWFGEDDPTSPAVLVGHNIVGCG